MKHEIIINPTKREFLKALNNAETGRLKGLIDEEGNLYLVDSYYLMHCDIENRAQVRATGIFELWFPNSHRKDTIIFSGNVDTLNKIEILKRMNIDFPENQWTYQK